MLIFYVNNVMLGCLLFVNVGWSGPLTFFSVLRRRWSMSGHSLYLQTLIHHTEWLLCMEIQCMVGSWCHVRLVLKRKVIVFWSDHACIFHIGLISCSELRSCSKLHLTIPHKLVVFYISLEMPYIDIQKGCDMFLVKKTVRNVKIVNKTTYTNHTLGC